MNTNTWPDGTPRSQGNAFTSWKLGRPSVMNSKEVKAAEAARRSNPGKSITIYSKAKASK